MSGIGKGQSSLSGASSATGETSGGKGKEKMAEEGEMNWNVRVCFIENLKAELAARENDLYMLPGWRRC